MDEYLNRPSRYLSSSPSTERTHIQQTVTSIFCSFAILTTMIRTAIRIKLQRRLLLDDWFLLLACVCLSAGFGLLMINREMIYFIEPITLNPQFNRLKSRDANELSSQSARFAKISDTFTVCIWAAVYSVKLSYLLFFKLLITNVTIVRRYWIFVFGLTVACGLFSLCGQFIFCPYTNSDICTSYLIIGGLD